MFIGYESRDFYFFQNKVIYLQFLQIFSFALPNKIAHWVLRKTKR